MAVKIFVLIQTATGKSSEVVANMRQLLGVKSVDLVTGPYDVIAVVEAESFGEFVSFFIERINLIVGISRTVTCVVIP